MMSMQSERQVDVATLVADWRRAGEPRRAELEAIAGEIVVHIVRGSERPFAELQDAALLYVAAAFQLGRAP